MPDLPHVETVQTPPGSVLTVRVPAELSPEEVFPLAEELHRQTGLPVIVLSADADLTVTTPEEATAALRTALADEGRIYGTAGQPLAPAALAALRVEGWELVRLRQP